MKFAEFDFACGAERAALGDALRWAQREQGEIEFPPISLWNPIPLPNAGEV